MVRFHSNGLAMCKSLVVHSPIGFALTKFMYTVFVMLNPCSP